ncbi:MAG: family 16 glycosylhydrolase, partial [Clostridia bacterium]|nr:family 16 glycosylhydrolase [Clostridia bacterium]
KVTSNKSRDFNYRAVLLANDRADAAEDLVAGNTYRLTFKLKTFPRYTPISSLAAEIKFGDYLWTNFATGAGSDIDITGEDLEAAVTGYTGAASGSVTFTVSFYVKLPEAAQWTGSRRHIMLSVYGGEYWLDDVTIQTTLAFPVEDENGDPVGTAYGHIGDKVSKLIPDSMKSNADYTYSASPSYIANFDDVITLTKTLKSNILEKVSFGSETYGGYTNTGSKYYETSEDATVTRNDSVMRYNNSNSGNTFGNRSVVIANNRTSALLTPGEKYALKIRIGTWDNNFNNLTAQIGFGDQCWVAGELVTFSNAQIRDSITGYGNSHVSMSGTDKKDLFLLLKFTVPTSIDSNKNLVLSLYGANKVNVTTYLYSAMIYSASQITFMSYDGTITAVAKGIEGDTATEAFDSTRNIKVTNFSETFDHSTTKAVSAGNYSYIERGDVDGDHRVATSLDYTRLIKHIIGETGFSFDDFGANANAITADDAKVDVADLVRIKNMILSPAAASEPIAGLTKSGYTLKWAYEFNDNTVDGDYFDMQYGMNRKYADITGVGSGEKRYNYVKDGALVLAPSDNYGAGNALVSDAYTTKTTMKFTYGYLEVCAKMAFSRADFPAIWLKSYGDPLYEIDLVETLGSSTSATCNLHYWKDDHDYSADLVSGRDKTITDTSAYHKYGFEWYKEGGVSYIAFYVDGEHVKTLSKNNIGYDADFNEEMYLILENLPITSAVYDNIHSWAGAALEATHSDYPMDMCIDYVRLYQTTNNSGNTFNTDY